jgi:hypothetical protein
MGPMSLFNRKIVQDLLCPLYGASGVDDHQFETDPYKGQNSLYKYIESMVHYRKSPKYIFFVCLMLTNALWFEWAASQDHVLSYSWPFDI